MTILQDRRFLIFLLCITGIFIIYHKMGPSTLTKTMIDNPSCARQFENVVSANRKCLLNKTKGKNDIWGMLDSTVTDCIDKTMWQRLDVHDMKVAHDDKWIILPANNSDQSCIQVTLGVGKRVGSEEQLLKLLPHCKLYGADPTLENGQVFNKVGKYFQVGVSDKNGTIQGSILQQGEGLKYKNEQIQSVDFMHLVRNMAKVDRIDYLWMDIEGGEYKVINKYLLNPSITICQWSMEMHGPVENYWMDQAKFNTMITSIFESSPFLPILSRPLFGHHGLFLINVQDPYCLEKYFLPKFCV